jgi:hypothetical protein
VAGRLLLFVATGLVATIGAGPAFAASRSGVCRDVDVGTGQQPSMLRLCKDASGRWTDSSSAGGPPDDASALPSGFEGRVSYGTGSYSGSIATPMRAPSYLNTRDIFGSISSLARSAQSSAAKPIEGGFSANVEFNGRVVRMDYRTTGNLRSGSISGTRDGRACRFPDTNGEWDLDCSREGLRGQFIPFKGSGPTIRVNLDATATQVTDYAAARRQQAEQAAAGGSNGYARDSAVLVDGDTAAVSPVRGAHHITVSMSDIDDLGLFIVITPDGRTHVASGAEWTVQNQGGSATENIDKYFKPGRNGLIFLLHNKAFSFGPGKWAFDASLKADARTLWSARRGSGGGGIGIQFWKGFYVTRKPNGAFDVEASYGSATAKLKPAIATINQRLISGAGTEQSAYGAMANVMAGAVFSGSGSASSSTPQDYPTRMDENGGQVPVGTPYPN